MVDSYLLEASSTWIFISIIVLGLLQEDFAVITGALLASENLISLPLSIIAIFVGIALGDIGLYFLGKTSTQTSKVRYQSQPLNWIAKLDRYISSKLRLIRYRLLTNKSMRYMRAQLRHRTLINLFIIRFIPGVRLVAYTLCGFLRISFYKFSFAIFMATSIWVLFVYTCIYQFGASEWLATSHNKWLIMPIAIAFVAVINQVTKRVLPSYKK